MSQLAHLCESADSNQGTVHRAEYQLQGIGNDGGNVGISVSLRQMCPTSARTARGGTLYMYVCQDLLNQYEAEGDSFLDHIITGDEMWCHHYKPESKWQSMGW